MNPIHRIEPRLLTVPDFYGSAGEPSILSNPRPEMPQMLQTQRNLSPGILAPYLLSLMAPNEAQGPLAPQMPHPPQQPPEVPNDEPLDIMPDTLPFKQAFAKARKMGLVEFTWRGKPYTTKLANG